MVQVRSAEEILATLDDEGCLDGLPFMPEMTRYCGRRLAVGQRAEKVCDTIHYTGSRRLRDAVMLEDLRCDGSAHGGCQAECRFFWKAAWLRPAGADSRPGGGEAALEARTLPATRRRVEVAGRSEERHRCQATDLPRATEQLRVWDPRAYLRELTSGNVPLGRFLRVTARAAVEEPIRKLGFMNAIPLAGTRAKLGPEPALGLQPGDLVQVKSPEEIAEFLTDQGRNRGLWFDREMLPHCGKIYRVRQRIHRFINDHDGAMIELKTDCVTLENCVCSGDLSVRRWFCPRAIYPYWRESWLRRVEPAAGAPLGGGGVRQGG
jgi:hypothetical protein